ncbi:hypothetical protein [Candidatus Amarolinea dominans]|uniref:hypothetical protein n=1 Tax=Candidatus Amarolinea dominans TaxID=3140696 RepID=UPI0031CCB143
MTPEIGDRRSETGDRRSEIGDRRPEIGDRRSEIGDRRSEIGDRRSVDLVGEDAAVNGEAGAGDPTGRGRGEKRQASATSSGMPRRPSGAAAR